MMGPVSNPRGMVSYVVEQEELHWTITCGGDHCGRFEHRKAALRSAVRDARRVRERGYPIEVWVRRRDGSARALLKPRIEH